MPALPTRRILGVDFFIGTLDAAVELALLAPSSLATSSSLTTSPPVPGNQQPATRCALVVAPSAPGLAKDLVQAPSYRQALQTAELVLTDSSFMVLLWWLFTGEKLPRHSGLKFLRALLARPELKPPGAIFWVMPSVADDIRNRAWLTAQGFPITPEDTYVAPLYAATGELADTTLTARIASRQPRVVMLAIGGGVQERLGVALRAQLTAKLGAGSSEPECSQPLATSQLVPRSPLPAPSDQLPVPSDQPPATTIMCLGAAIGFLSGGQPAIPPWADRLYLGWLFRLVTHPRAFSRRLWPAVHLPLLIWRLRERDPATPHRDVQ